MFSSSGIGLQDKFKSKLALQRTQETCSMRQTTAVAMNFPVCERSVYIAAVTALSIYHKVHVPKF